MNKKVKILLIIVIFLLGMGLIGFTLIKSNKNSQENVETSKRSIEKNAPRSITKYSEDGSKEEIQISKFLVSEGDNSISFSFHLFNNRDESIDNEVLKINFDNGDYIIYTYEYPIEHLGGHEDMDVSADLYFEYDAIKKFIFEFKEFKTDVYPDVN